MSTFTYSISQDFPNGEIDITNFIQEVHQSTITIKLTTATLDGDSLTLTFATTISAAEKTILDGDTTNPAGGIIANHNPISTILGETVISQDPIFLSASNLVQGQRTITANSWSDNIISTSSKFIQPNDNAVPNAPAAGQLTVQSDDSNENAVLLSIEYLDTNLDTVKVYVPISGSTQTIIAASAWRLQKAIIAQSVTKYGSNTGTLSFAIGGVLCGTIEPGEGWLKSLFWTTPANSMTNFLAFTVSAEDGGNDAIVEITIHLAYPIDSANCPSAVLYKFFTNAGIYMAENKYLPVLPGKTDVYFTAKYLTGGTTRVTGHVTMREVLL